MRFSLGCFTALTLFAGLVHPAPPIGACPGGQALSSFDISVFAAESSDKVPLRALTRLEGGTRLRYEPREIYAADQDDAEVALISIPTTPTGVLAVMESKKASQPAEWVIPSRAAAVALVYGAQGFSTSKLVDLVRRDPQLITQLAAYAEKSAQTEALMETVANWERSGSTQTLENALAGFSSRYGVAMPMLNRTATTDQQALTLMRALHPAIATFDPLTPSQATLLQQSGSLAAAVGGLFFGNPVGLATAGGAMFLNMRSLLFPGSEFRSALAQPYADTSVLCAKRENKSRTKLVYLWAWKLPGAPAPRLDGLPYRVNLEQLTLTIPLKGANLQNIRSVATSLEGAAIAFTAEPPALTLTLPETAAKGTKIDLRLEVEDSPAPMLLPAAIELLGPRPILAAVRPSLPPDLPLRLAAGELPANAFTAATVRVTGAGPLPTLHLECTDPMLTVKKLSLRPGDQTSTARLRAVSSSEFFLSFEPGSVGQAPCELAARVETSDGVSEALAVGRIVRLPRIEKFSLTSEMAAGNTYLGWLEGEELEAIEKTGWNEEAGVEVTASPLPVSNSGSRQRLRVAMPWPPPAPQSPLYVWLRGESSGRRTTVVY
ncbi:MAG: hypothetical protein JNK87_00520 [Bryobacterales bacterium]|nr:hypothetical protein [Bryobacterales bacterium]